MIKQLLMAGLLTVGATAVYAQQATSPRAADPQVATMPAGADVKKLIGRNVKNPQNDTIGEIESVYINADGKVDSVIVGVGGFLGMGERLVRLAWKDLQVSENGEKVVVNMTKDQLKAMAPYTYKEPKVRGQVFTDSGVYAPTTDRDRRAATTATESTGDFNARGAVSGNALIGSKVYNANKDTVGTVEDIYVDAKGAIDAVIVSVGGFLGMGEKHVAVKWSDLKYGRDDKSLLLTTDWTKDSLKAMPDYKYERRKRG